MAARRSAIDDSLVSGRRGGRLGAELTTTVEEDDTITDELAAEPEEDSPSAEDMLTDRDPGKEVD